LQITWSAHSLRVILAGITLTAATLLPACVSVQYTAQEPYYVTENVTENITEPYNLTTTVVRSISREQPLTPYMLWGNPQLQFNDRLYLWYYGYSLADLPAHEEESIKITFFDQQYFEYVAVSVFDVTPRGQLLAPPRISATDVIPATSEQNWIKPQGEIATFDTWLRVANAKLDFARFLGGVTNIFLNISNPDPVIVKTRGSKEIAVLISGPANPQNRRFGASLQWTETVAENITAAAEHIVTAQSQRRVLMQRPVVKTKQVPFWENLPWHTP
jgi:hypothetical protein